jgi:F-type H+-transporting ATPase subunit O
VCGCVQALDNRTLGRLETAVSKSSYVGAGKKLKVTNTVCVSPPSLQAGTKLTSLPPSQVNPDIVGGLIVEIGDRTIDLSVSSKIHKMNKLLTDTL